MKSKFSGLLTWFLPRLLNMLLQNTLKVKNTYLLQSCAQIHLIRGLLHQKITEGLSNTRHSLFNVLASCLPHKGNIPKSFISTVKAFEVDLNWKVTGVRAFLEMAILVNKNRFTYFYYKLRRIQFHLFPPNQITNTYKQMQHTCYYHSTFPQHSGTNASSPEAHFQQHHPTPFCFVYDL